MAVVLSNALRVATVCAFALLVAGESFAHRVNESYLYLQIHRDTVTGRFELPLDEFNRALQLTGTPREVTEDTLDRDIGFLKDYYRTHVTIADARGPLPITFTSHGFLNARGGFAQLSFDLGGLPQVPDALTFDYSVLFDEDPSHRGFLIVEHNWATGTFANENRVSLVFSPTARRQVFSLTSSGVVQGVVALGRLGAEHMVLGLDHLFFLLALLLPTVLRREASGWQPLERLGPALRNVVTIVTAFVAAHLLALGLAVLGLHLPEALVETVIAASTTVAAANVLVPLFRRGAWWIVFGLSLFHGFGLAGGLLDLGAIDEHRALSVFAYSLGVEAGQMLLVVVLFSLLFLVRRLAVYRRVFLPLAAVGMMLVSGVWVVERSLGVDVPMRELLPAAVQRVLP